MRRDDNALLLDIAHAGGLVAKFMAGKNKAAFLADELTQSAVRHFDKVKDRYEKQCYAGKPAPIIPRGPRRNESHA